MHAFLIDDRGEIWSNASARLRTAFAPTCSDDEFAEYLVRNLGFVSISVFGKSCQFKVRPATLATRALDGLINWLAGHAFDRYVMNWYDDDWRLELHGESDIVVRRLLQLVSLNQIVRPGEFISQPIEKERLARSRIFHSLIESWPSLAGNLHLDGLRNIINTMTNGRYFLVRSDRSAQRLVYHEAGNGFTPVNNDWISSARGTPVDEQPDRAYGHWVAASYDRVIKSEVAAFETVDAIVETQTAGRQRIRYTRIMLPSQSADGTRWLLGASAMDNRIDLRLESA